jgi:hypothetical protein
MHPHGARLRSEPNVGADEAAAAVDQGDRSRADELKVVCPQRLDASGPRAVNGGLPPLGIIPLLAGAGAAQTASHQMI